MRVDELDLLVERHRVGDLAGAGEQRLDRPERPGHRQPAEERRRALEQRRDGGRERARRDDVEPVDRSGSAWSRGAAPGAVITSRRPRG